MSSISTIISEESNHLKKNYGYFTDEELKEAVDIAIKYHDDNSFDYKSAFKEVTLAKLVKNLIIDKEVNKDKYIKEALEEIYLLNDINNDRDNIKKEIEDNKENIREYIKEYIEKEKKQREMMEVTLKEKAEECTDEEEKKRMLDTSKAYTDSYTLERFIEFIRSDNCSKFKNKIKNNKTRIKRLFTDCDYIIDKVISVNSSNTIRFNDLSNKILNHNIEKYDSGVVCDFVILLALHLSKSIDITYKPDLWYGYNLIDNINHLFSINTFATDFDKEKDKNLEKVFNEIIDFKNKELNKG